MDLLFIPTDSGDVIALDVETGQKKWARSLHPERKFRVQAVSTWNDLLLLGMQNLADLPTYNRTFLALKAGTGEEAWNCPTKADNLSTPVVEENTAFFTTSEPQLKAFDLEEQRMRWSIPSVTWSPDSPSTASEMIVVPSRGPKVAAFRSSDGRPEWTFTADDPENEQLHFRPALSADTAYFSGWGKRLYAVDLPTGNLRWRFQARRGITCPPVLAGDKLLVAVKDVRPASEEIKPGYGLYALDCQTGEVVWKFQTDRHIYASPAVSGHVVLFGADDKRLHVLDVETGGELWQFACDEKIRTSPLLVGKHVYIGQQNHTVCCLQWQDDSTAPQDPEALLAQGRPLEAAVVLALAGRYAASARLYAEQGEREHAAVLFLEAGQPLEAAEIYVQLAEYERALALYNQAGDRAGEARVLDLMDKHAEAAAIYEEIGDIDKAAQAYIQAGRAGHAAILMLKVGRRTEAARLFQMVNQDDQAAEVLVEEKNFAQAGEIYLRIHKPEVAAAVFAQGGLLDQAAAVNEKIGQTRLAADQYAQAGQLEPALRLYETLQDWSHVAELAEKEGNLPRAADALVRLGQLERAAQFYLRSGRADTAMDQYEALGKWEKVAALAGERQQWQRRANALSNLGMMNQAGEAYELAAKELRSRSPEDVEPAAALYEAAARCYAEDDDWLHHDPCMDMVCQLRGWPYIKARFELSEGLYQGEYSLVTMEVKNAGYSPAHNIQIHCLSQKFILDEAESQVSLRMLGVQQERSLRLMLQPLHNVLGSLLLRFELICNDASGREHQFTCEEGVKVLGQMEKAAGGMMDMPPRTPISDLKINEEVVRLTRGLVEFFNDEELQDLCFLYLQIEYENLRGETKNSRARELVLLMRRYNRLPELKEILRQLRPNVTW